MRERGLKYYVALSYRMFYGVAPREGAWIEIVKKLVQSMMKKSLPVRERGLKYQR